LGGGDENHPLPTLIVKVSQGTNLLKEVGNLYKKEGEGNDNNR